LAWPARDRAIARAVNDMRRGRERSLTDIMAEAAKQIGIDLKPGRNLTRHQLGELLAVIRTMASR
jgi:hypothetical protein